MLELQQSQEGITRIYSTVNTRDLKKSILLFKKEQLEYEYNNREEDFYLDIRNKFISCLMRPANRSQRNFLFDIDTTDKTILDKTIEELKEVKILLTYPTKNGWHIITEPFNYTEMTVLKNNSDVVSLQKDGMMLLSFNDFQMGR